MKTAVIAAVIIAVLIADTFYVYRQLKKLWKKSRYNPANRDKNRNKHPLYPPGTGL